jgi:hypothetical protein
LGLRFSLGEGVDIGMDIGSPIDFTYKLPFAFTGKIEKVTIELRPERAAAWPKPPNRALAWSLLRTGSRQLQPVRRGRQVPG